MGFFGELFGKLFGKKKQPAFGQASDSGNITIDIREDGFVINGKKLDIPTHIKALSDVLGKPSRKTAFKTSEEDKEVYAKMHPGEILVQRVNYTWDGLGLMCYTNNGSVVNCFGICMNPAGYNAASDPKSMFKGTVLINGKPWLGVMKAGKDLEVFRKVILGSYSLVAEYTDFEQDDSTRGESSFTGIEIQLNDGADPDL